MAYSALLGRKTRQLESVAGRVYVAQRAVCVRSGIDSGFGRDFLERKMAAERTQECDVLVVGSGASGMAAAVTAASYGLKVLIAEKEPRFGGTTARSGGWLWIPGTSLARSWGISESPELARTYLQHEA